MKVRENGEQNRKKVLIVSHYFPPLTTITTRPYLLAKYLSRKYDVYVITTKKTSFHGVFSFKDKRKENLESSGVRIFEVKHQPFDFIYNIITRYIQRKGVRDGETGKDDGTAYKVSENILFKLKAFRDVFLKIFGPNFDIFFSWLPNLMYQIFDLKRKYNFDFIITTFPPPTVVIAGFLTKITFPDVIWIQDYRDLWSYDVYFSNPAVVKLTLPFERALISKADCITTISFHLEEILKSVLGRKIYVIRNSFDPEEFDISELTKKVKEKGEKRKINRNAGKSKKVFSYTGAFYPKGRNPEKFFESLHILSKKYGDLKDKIEVNIYGIPNMNISQLIQKYNLDDIVHYRGVVSYGESREIQKISDFLLFFNITEVRLNENLDKGVITGKIFEYITSGVPIISIGLFEDSEANQIIKGTGTGIFVKNEPEKIADLLEKILYKGWEIPFEPDLNKIMEFSAENMANKFAELFDKPEKQKFFVT